MRQCLSVGRHPSSYALGRRAFDLAALGVVLAFFLATCFTLRVYYRVTVYEVSVERIDADGTRTKLETPNAVDQLILWHLEADEVLTRLRRAIDGWMEGSGALREISEGARVEWTVRYSYNSARLDERRVFVYSEAVRGGG